MNGIIRFAPSPTGYLHYGHILSALYVWAFAKKEHLQIHLRIEDHDQGRSRLEFAEAIKEDLQWLGFVYDTESIQSKHFCRYEDILDKLTNKGLVYPCYCTRKILEIENPKNQYGEIIYQGKCFNQKTPLHKPHSLRIHINDEIIHWTDLRLGEFFENPQKQCGDIPIQDREGQWTYQFAVSVDDLDENITHIVRGEDLRSSTARQILLMKLLGQKKTCIYYHHPLLYNVEGKKLSKREKSHSIREDIQQGLTREEILGFVLYKAKIQKNNMPISLNDALVLIQKSF